MVWEWKKLDPFELTRYVLPDARKDLPLHINVHDFLQQESGIYEITKIIYNTLLNQEIQYAREKYDPSAVIQRVLEPSEILNDYLEGTCLDLALLFSGLCLGCDLLPILIIFEGHALVAVSLNHGLREWNAFKRKEYESAFKRVMLPDGRQMQDLIESGAYLAVECTGFAFSKSLSDTVPEGIGRREDGSMTFERATKAGSEQFGSLSGRRFDYALDIAVAHNFWKLGPSDNLPVAGTVRRSHSLPSRVNQANPPKYLLPILLDRNDQEWDLKKAVLYRYAKMPLRPLVCIVHGNDSECHTEFLIRLKEETIPSILTYWDPERTSQVVVDYYRIPLSLKKLTATNYKDVIWEELSSVTNGSRIVSKEDVTRTIVDKKSAAVINVPLHTEEWDGIDLKKVELFFEFWESWPNLSEDFLLVVCLCIRHRENYRPKKRSFFQRFNRRNPNTEMQKYIDNLDFYKFRNIHGSVLTELQAIRQVDAEALIEHERVRQFYDFEESDIRKLYRDAKLCVTEGHIPMETLLDSLSLVYRQKQEEI